MLDRNIMAFAEETKAKILENKGRAISDFQDTTLHSEIKEKMRVNLPSIVETYNVLRRGTENTAPLDKTLGEYASTLFGFSKEDAFNQLLLSMGIDQRQTKIGSFIGIQDLRAVGNAIVPEIIMEAIRLGIKASDTSKLIANTQTVASKFTSTPYIKDLSGGFHYVNDGEAADKSQLTFLTKQVPTKTIQCVISLSDSVKETPLNLLGEAMIQVANLYNRQRAGAILDCIVNGDKTDYSAPVVGVQSTTDGFKYIDLKVVLTRLQNLGYNPNVIIGKELAIIGFGMLDEIKGYAGGTQLINVTNMQPDVRNLWSLSHGAVPDNELIIMDGTRCINEYVYKPLMMEQDRDILTRLNNISIVADLGFGKMLRDSAVRIDKTKAFSGNDFPSYMDVATIQQTGF